MKTVDRGCGISKFLWQDDDRTVHFSSDEYEIVGGGAEDEGRYSFYPGARHTGTKTVNVPKDEVERTSMAAPRNGVITTIRHRDGCPNGIVHLWA